MHVPEEIWDAILTALLVVTDDELMTVIPLSSGGAAVTTVCKQFYRLATPYLYSLLTVTSLAGSDALFHTLTSKPSLATYVNAVAVNGGYESFLNVAACLASSGVHAVSMSLSALDAIQPGDRIAIPGRPAYLGRCIATMRPKVVIIAAATGPSQSSSLNLFDFVMFSAWRCALNELWSWSDAESVYFNFLARPKDLARTTVPPQVHFTHLWICINFEANEHQYLMQFLKKPALQHVHLHVVPSQHTRTIFLPAFLDAVKEDVDLRQRVHLESDMGSSRIPLGQRVQDGRKKRNIPIALSAARGHRWEL